MSKVRLNLTVPSELSDITLEQYQKYMKVVEVNKDVEDATDFLNLKALDIFCGIDIKDSYNLPVKHFLFALEQLETCFKEETPLVRRFKTRDNSGKEHEFGMIPNLEEMTIGEYTDLEKYISDWGNMHKAMAVLFRPIKTVFPKDMYEIYEYEGSGEYAEAMKELPVNIALGAIVFFYRLGMKLSENMMDYSKNHPEIQKKLNEDLVKGGDGTLLSMLYARETLLDSMNHLKFHSIRH